MTEPVIEAEMLPKLGRPTPTVEGYLYELAALALEVARQPRLWPVFVQIIRRVPRTVRELRAKQRLAA